MKISAILLAAGEGRRLGKSRPKAFVAISGKEILLVSIELFEAADAISETILVVPKSEIANAKKLTVGFSKISKIVAGGDSRQKSLAAGLKFCREKFVLSQNAANPFATENEIARLVKTLQKCDAAGVAWRADSTVRLETKTLPRQKIWLMETPQLVKKDFLDRGLKIANSQKIETTDEIQLAELAGAKIKILPADPENRKITRPADLDKIPFAVANQISNSKEIGRRVGLGVDSHKFSQKKKTLVLGGIQISKDEGLAANSDGDVVLHALTNAISSALGGGSLSNFANPLCRRGVKNSQKYLAVVLAKLKKADFTIENLAISIEGSRPKLEKHFLKIRQSLAAILKISTTKIGLVATTGEGLTAFGRGEGLQVFVIVLLKSL